MQLNRCHTIVLPLLINCILLNAGFVSSELHAQDVQRGVVLNTDKATPGYTLIAPFGGQETFLINLNGDVVHSWKTERTPSQAAYLLPDGCLLRTTKIPNVTFKVKGGPAGGIQKFSWDGELLWDFAISSQRRLTHHDTEPLPNGNVLVVAWDLKTRAEAIAAGRDPQKIEDGVVWSEVVLEIKPDGLRGGIIVWEWHLWDHLVQSFDSSKANFGQPADHPELVDINFAERPIADWIHMNSIDYNADLDQILMSGRTFDEIWVIDHSPKPDAAAGHTGGRSGKGGDLLYRWGNPFAYFAGTPFDQVLFGQHDPHWIAKGLPGAGNIMIFNNGSDRDERPFSTVDELVPPLAANGSYQRTPNEPFGPAKLTWTYQDRSHLYSQRISGSQRLPNGNTLICAGETGHVFEVTTGGEIVWDFHNTLGDADGNAVATANVKAGGALTGVAMFRATRFLPNDPAVAGRTFNRLTSD